MKTEELKKQIDAWHNAALNEAVLHPLMGGVIQWLADGAEVAGSLRYNTSLDGFRRNLNVGYARTVRCFDQLVSKGLIEYKIRPSVGTFITLIPPVSKQEPRTIEEWREACPDYEFFEEGEVREGDEVLMRSGWERIVRGPLGSLVFVDPNGIGYSASALRQFPLLYRRKRVSETFPLEVGHGNPTEGSLEEKMIKSLGLNPGDKLIVLKKEAYEALKGGAK